MNLNFQRSNKTKTIKLEDLQRLINRINEIKKAPMETYKKDDNKLVAQIGNFHISSAYGGHSLHRIVNKNGATSDVLQIGHVSKKELYNSLHAYLRGMGE